MCLILFSYKTHPKYKLIVAANRDEFYERKTSPADFWDDHPQVLAGRDLEAMGTWMGINKNGRISMLTNYRDLANLKPHAPTRGHLVSNFLITEASPDDYLTAIDPLASKYNDYNLLLGSIDDLWYYSNRQRKKIMLGSGIYGLSNHLLDTSWPKVVLGKKRLQEIMREDVVTEGDLLDMLYMEMKAPDEELPDTGVGIEMERMLSPMFIKSSKYGTRCSTVLIISNENEVTFAERTYDTSSFSFIDRSFQFTID